MLAFIFARESATWRQTVKQIDVGLVWCCWHPLAYGFCMIDIGFIQGFLHALESCVGFYKWGFIGPSLDPKVLPKNNGPHALSLSLCIYIYILYIMYYAICIIYCTFIYVHIFETVSIMLGTFQLQVLGPCFVFAVPSTPLGPQCRGYQMWSCCGTQQEQTDMSALILIEKSL